jgi:hypothetical protein
LTRVLKVVFVSGEDAISAVFFVVFLLEAAPALGGTAAAGTWLEDGVEDCAEDCAGAPA